MAIRGYITLGSGEAPYILKDESYRYMGNFATFEDAQKVIRSAVNQQLRYVDDPVAGTAGHWRIEDLF